VTELPQKNSGTHFRMNPLVAVLISAGVIAVALVAFAVLTDYTPPPTEADLMATSGRWTMKAHMRTRFS